MINSVTVIVVVLATITSGLTAGLFWGFAYAVMPALRQADDRTFVTVMHTIDTVILNGWFVFCFAGAGLFGVLAVILAAIVGSATVPWLIGAIVVYLIACVITFAVNIPLNATLVDLDVDDPVLLAGRRAGFEDRWNRANVLRAAGHTIAFAASGIALLAY